MIDSVLYILLCTECDSIRRLFFKGLVLCSQMLPDVLLNISSRLLSSYSHSYLGIILIKY